MSYPDPLPDNTAELEALIDVHENEAAPLKNNTRARIIWHNPEKKEKTEYAILYLHGFKSSQGEGFPVHQAIAKRFGCNLYLARLHDHGLKRDQYFKDLTREKLILSAIDACRIAQKIGEKVLVMGTSTGGSLAMWAAASPECPVIIHALILYSPLVHLYGINSLLLENRLSREFLRFFPGKNHIVSHDPFAPGEETIWYSSYCLNGAIVLGETIQKIMQRETFTNITCPVFVGYYYKNRDQHDRVVSTSAIKRMVKKLKTPASNIRVENFPTAGSHVICSSLLSGAVQEVTNKTSLFLEKTVELLPEPQQ